MGANINLIIINTALIFLVVIVAILLVIRRRKGPELVRIELEREVLVVDDELILKSIDTSETEAFFTLMDDNRKYLRQWLPWLDDTKSEQDAKRFIESAMAQRSDGLGVHYSIYYQGSIVGIVGQTFKTSSQMSTIGYWLVESGQHKGIMTRCVDFLVKRDFQELNINRVEIRVATNNIRSRAIPERLDFKEEGRLRSVEWLYDHYVDHIVYGRLKSDDWKL